MELQIYSKVKELIGDYEKQNIQIVPGLHFQQYKQIKTAEFYSNSKYLNEYGNKDSLDREIPFYNIVNYRVTLAKVATDLDTKDVTIESDDPNHYVHSMLLQHEAYEWMKETNFAQFLNSMGQIRPKYGGVLVKKTTQKDKDGNDEIHIDTVDWRNVTTDQIDILSGAIIETHFMTPHDLVKKMDTWDNVVEFIEAINKQRSSSNQYGTEQEQRNTDRGTVYEVTGQFPKSVYAECDDETEPDDYEYSLQHYFLGEVDGKCFPLFCEELEEKDFQYKYLPWETMPGRALGRGVIEDAEEAQVWTNDAVINEKNAMDLAGKVVVKTTSREVGSNILELDNGRIFELNQGEDINVVNLEPGALGEFTNQIQRWQSQANDATSSYDANSGKQPPADTPYSQTALLNQVAAKPFDYRREEAGIFITEIFNDWVIPYLVKKLYKKHILASEFTQDELEVIDDAFASFKVDEKILPLILNGSIVTAEQRTAAIAAYKGTLKGKRRFIEVPNGFFSDVEAKVTVMTTGEQKNKAAILQSLSTILGDVQQSYNPQTGTFGVLENPIMARIFGTILELSGAGISPISLGIGKPQASQQQTQAPAGQPQAPQQNPQATPGVPSPSPQQVQAPAIGSTT